MNIKNRCLNPSAIQYKDYGGRGILLSSYWLTNFAAFDAYVSKLPNAYRYGYTLDRVYNNYNYEPMNLRWVQRGIQNENNRLLRSTNTSGYRGVSYNKPTNNWTARIQHNGKRISLGYFDTAKQGAIAYNNWVQKNNTEHPLNIFKE